MAPQFNLPAGRGPVGQNLPAPNVDFNPAPQANPIDAAMQGWEKGQSLGLRAQQMQIAQQDNQRKQREQEDKDFGAYSVAIKNLHALPDKLKPSYWDTYLVPLSNRIGIPATKGWDPSLDSPIADDVKDLIAHHEKDPKNYTRTMLKDHILQLGYEHQKAGEETTAKYLQDMAKQYEDPAANSGVQDRFDSNLAYKKEQDWGKLGDKVNALGASSRKALGVAATANMRADRLNTLANDPNATPEDIRREVIDLEGIMTGGVPHEMSIKYGDISNAQTKLAKLAEAITSKPQAANVPEWQNRLKEVANGLRQVDNKIIHDNLGVNAVAYRGIINEDRGRWNDLVAAVNQSVTPSSGANTGAPTVMFTDSDGDTHIIPAANLAAARKRDPGLRVQ